MIDATLAGEMVDQFPGTPSWHFTQAMSLAESGQLDEARALLDTHALRDPGELPKDPFWIPFAYMLRSLVLRLDDDDLARASVAAYEPYADTTVHYMIAFNGPMRHYLGAMRVVAAGDIDDGIADGRQALDWMVDSGNEIHATFYRVEFAELLLRRGSAAPPPSSE